MKKIIFTAIIIIVLIFSLLWAKGVFSDKQQPDEDLNNNIADEHNEVGNNKIEDISQLIPDGWEILKQADGDLNNDGIMDKAFVIEQSDESNIASPRSLMIAFGNEDNTYQLSISAEKAVLLECDGGTFGDPFEDLVIDRGSVLLKFMGGSSRWHRYYRFRYQDDGWYLIGFTEGSYEAIDDEMFCLEDDYNLITGEYIGKKLEDGKIITIEKNIGAKVLLNLNDFVAAEYNIQPE